MRWAGAIGALLTGWLTVQTIVVARRTSVETDEMAGIAVTVVSLALALSVVMLGTWMGVRRLRRRPLTMPSRAATAIAALVAGLLVCPTGVAPLGPDGDRELARNQSCDGLAPLPEALRARAAQVEPRLSYSEGCIFDL